MIEVSGLMPGMARATADEIDEVMAIIVETIAEMERVGNHQWDDKYPKQTVFESDIAKGNLYTCRDDSGELVGVVVIDQTQPEEYGDVPWQYDIPVLVIHRTAVGLAARQKGIGRKLVAFAEALALAQEIVAIRSDTYSTNEAMNAMFQKLDYQFSGHINFQGRPLLFNCYEKKLV